MAVSDERVKEVTKYLEDHGVGESAEHFGLSRSSIRRYRRAGKYVSSSGHSHPKILLFDIETSPMECYAWRTGKQYVSDNNIIKETSILSWSAKWLMGDTIEGHKVTPEEAIDREDHNIVKSLNKILNEADILIAHNINFDKKVANTRFILNGLNPPTPYQTIDTYKEAKRHFRFPSNKLDYISQILTGDRKIKTSFELWKRCVNGDSSAIDDMLKYNKQDVRILEEVYIELRPWIKSHPNLGLYYEDMSDRCPNCGSRDLTNNGFYYTSVNKYRSKTCNECGAHGRDRQQSITTKQKCNLWRSQAR